MDPGTESNSEVRELSARGPRASSKASPLLRLCVLITLLACAALGFATSAGWFDPASENRYEYLSRNASNDIEREDSLPLATEVGGESDLEADVDPGTLGFVPASKDSTPALPIIAPDTVPEILQEATAVFQHLAACLPDSIEAREVRARFEYEFGEVQAAERMWREILNRDPNYVYAHSGLGKLSFEEGRFDEAVEHLQQAANLESSEPSRYYTLARALISAGDLERAEAVLLSALKADPEYTLAEIELGTLFLQKGEYTEAQRRFETAIEREPDDVQAHFGLARTLLQLGERERAAAEFERHRSLQAREIELLEESRRAYDDIAATTTDLSKMYAHAARLYASAGFGPAAEEVLLRASQLDAQNVESRQALAAIAVARQQPFDAIRWLNEVRQLRPEDFVVTNELVRLHLRIGQVEKARQLLLDFHDGSPQDLQALRSLTQFFTVVVSNKELAVKFAGLAEQVEPTAASKAMSASVYVAFGELQQALDSMNEAIALDPSNADYSAALEEIATAYSEELSNEVPNQESRTEEE